MLRFFENLKKNTNLIITHTALRDFKSRLDEERGPAGNLRPPFAQYSPKNQSLL